TGPLVFQVTPAPEGSSTSRRLEPSLKEMRAVVAGSPRRSTVPSHPAPWKVSAGGASPPSKSSRNLEQVPDVHATFDKASVCDTSLPVSRMPVTSSNPQDAEQGVKWSLAASPDTSSKAARTKSGSKS